MLTGSAAMILRATMRCSGPVAQRLPRRFRRRKQCRKKGQEKFCTTTCETWNESRSKNVRCPESMAATKKEERGMGRQYYSTATYEMEKTFLKFWVPYSLRRMADLAEGYLSHGSVLLRSAGTRWKVWGLGEVTLPTGGESAMKRLLTNETQTIWWIVVSCSSEKEFGLVIYPFFEHNAPCLCCKSWQLKTLHGIVDAGEWLRSRSIRQTVIEKKCVVDRKISKSKNKMCRN